MKNLTVFFPTVKHSGTRIVQQEVFGDWCQYTLGGNSRFGCTDAPRRLCHAHVTPSMVPMFYYMDEYIAVVPFRHPARIYESWTRRPGRSPFIATLTKQIEDLVNYVHKRTGEPPYYIVLDSPHRDAQVQRLATRLGVPLTPDFGQTISEAKTVDIGITDEMIARVPQFALDFYEEVAAPLE